MRNLLLFALLNLPIISYSQCYLDVNGVTTDPRNSFQNAVNPVDPEFTNRFFDWTKDIFTNLNWVSTIQGPPIANQPHNLPDNSTALIYNNDDFKPDDGWELIRYNKGYLNFWEDDDGNGLT